MLNSSTLEEIKKSTCFETRLKQFTHHRVQSLDQNSDHALNFLNPSTDQKNLKMIEDLIEGSDFNCHPEIKPYAPTLLWFYTNFIINFWIHDKTEKKIKTTHLIDSLTPLALKPIYMSRFSFAAAAVKPVVQLLQNFIKIN